VEDAFTANSSNKELTTDILLNVIKSTHSLSVIMKEQLEQMSAEYEKRKFRKASN